MTRMQNGAMSGSIISSQISSVLAEKGGLTMDDYISRDYAVENMENFPWDTEHDKNAAIHLVRELVPAADVRPVVEAHWEWDENGMDWNLGAWTCSNCRRKAETWWANDKHNPLRCAGSHFCGNCGADCRGGNDGK